MVKEVLMFGKLKQKLILWVVKSFFKGGNVFEKIWAVLDGKKMYLLGVARILGAVIEWLGTQDSAKLMTEIWEGFLIIAGKSALNKIAVK